MATILSDVGLVVTAALGWVGSVATTITGQPILMVFCIIPLVGLGVGLFRRLMNVQ